MLSIGKLTPGRANYYVDQLPTGADEYYLTGDTDGAARWLGAAAERLGLDGPVTPDAFRLMLDGRHPTSGDPLGVPLQGPAPDVPAHLVHRRFPGHPVGGA